MRDRGEVLPDQRLLTLGVDIEEGASNNTIGGTAIGAGNLISGNTAQGVFIGADSTGNQLLGNKIGTNAAGTNAIGNATGVDIFGPSNTVGGTAIGAGNAASDTIMAVTLRGIAV